MNNAVLIQQCWPGDVGGKGDYQPLMELTKDRNQDYCEKHGFDYVYLVGCLSEKYANVYQGGWVKVELIRTALAKGYEYVIWLDPDALIYDMETDLRDACPKGIGSCWMRIPQLNHWNVGVLYMRNTPEVRKFIGDWLESFPGERDWMEQGEFNKLALKGRVVETISDRWNATINYSMVPDAVVLGYHGNGDAPQRFSMMRDTLISLSKKAEADAGLQREVTDG